MGVILLCGLRYRQLGTLHLCDAVLWKAFATAAGCVDNCVPGLNYGAVWVVLHRGISSCQDNILAESAMTHSGRVFHDLAILTFIRDFWYSSAAFSGSRGDAGAMATATFKTCIFKYPAKIQSRIDHE